MVAGLGFGDLISALFQAFTNALSSTSWMALRKARGFRFGIRQRSLFVVGWFVLGSLMGSSVAHGQKLRQIPPVDQLQSFDLIVQPVDGGIPLFTDQNVDRVNGRIWAPGADQSRTQYLGIRLFGPGSSFPVELQRRLMETLRQARLNNPNSQVDARVLGEWLRLLEQPSATGERTTVPWDRFPALLLTGNNLSEALRNPQTPVWANDLAHFLRYGQLAVSEVLVRTQGSASQPPSQPPIATTPSASPAVGATAVRPRSSGDNTSSVSPSRGSTEAGIGCGPGSPCSTAPSREASLPRITPSSPATTSAPRLSREEECRRPQDQIPFTTWIACQSSVWQETQRRMALERGNPNSAAPEHPSLAGFSLPASWQRYEQSPFVPRFMSSLAERHSARSNEIRSRCSGSGSESEACRRARGTMCYRETARAIWAARMAPTWSGSGDAWAGLRDLPAAGFVNLLENRRWAEVLLRNPELAPRGAVFVYSGGNLTRCAVKEGQLERGCGHMEVKTAPSGQHGYIFDYITTPLPGLTRLSDGVTSAANPRRSPLNLVGIFILPEQTLAQRERAAGLSTGSNPTRVAQQ